MAPCYDSLLVAQRMSFVASVLFYFAARSENSSTTRVLVSSLHSAGWAGSVNVCLLSLVHYDRHLDVLTPDMDRIVMCWEWSFEWCLLGDFNSIQKHSSNVSYFHAAA